MRARAQAALETNDGLRGRTVKLEIGTGDCYLKVATFEGRLVNVDLTVSRIGGEDEAALTTPRMAVLECSKRDVTRALLEVACREASDLLQAGVWDAARLVATWRGTRFDPEGGCAQVQGVVASPLDAAARWIEMKIQEGKLK